MWQCPRIKARSAPITLPTEERIDKIISAGLQKWITAFSISNLGLRPAQVAKHALCKLAGRVRFELTTSSLEGWLAIRAATSAQLLGRKIGVQVLRFPIGLTEEENLFRK